MTVTTDWKAKEAARASAAAALQAANPHLVPANKATDGLIAAAKNIRIELKRAFPLVKFSVTSSRFSGGNSIDVSWIDGPVTKQVDRIINKYAAGSFDGQTDSYDYEASTWTDAFGDAKYVHSRRDDSDKALESAIRSVKAAHGDALGALADSITVTAFRNGDLWRTKVTQELGWSLSRNLQDLVCEVVNSRTWAIDKTPKAQPMVEVEETAA